MIVERTAPARGGFGPGLPGASPTTGRTSWGHAIPPCAPKMPPRLPMAVVDVLPRPTGLFSSQRSLNAPALTVDAPGMPTNGPHAPDQWPWCVSLSRRCPNRRRRQEGWALGMVTGHVGTAQAVTPRHSWCSPQSGTENIGCAQCDADGLQLWRCSANFRGKKRLIGIGCCNKLVKWPCPMPYIRKFKIT